MGQCLAGWRAVRRFAAQPAPAAPAEWPLVTLLKPLHGDEPLLEAALASACGQDYPRFRVVCGVKDAADPAGAVVARLRARFPPVTLVVEEAEHGPNRKVGNLMNMLAAMPQMTADEVVVIADSDIHAEPDWLREVVASLCAPGVGLATTLYAGLAARPGLVGRLGASAITHGFLPGALLARGMGRQDCLGATMALRRDTLAAVGGLAALVEHLADDNVLGRLVRGRGLAVALARAVPTTTVAESRLRDLWQHELRWARTIRGLVPGQFALSALQYPIAWALLALVLSGGSWAWVLLGLAWTVRAGAARGIDRALGLAARGLATPADVWIPPLRDVLSVGLVLVSYLGHRVTWRGAVMDFRAGRRGETSRT